MHETLSTSAALRRGAARALLQLVALTCALAPFANAASDETTATRAELARLFAVARESTAGVVPLILRASSVMRELDAREASLLGDTLEPYCRRAFFGPEVLPEMERLGLGVHVVDSGELPSKIAQRYRIGAGVLAYLNDGYDERRLSIGKELKVVDLSDKSLSITVTKSVYRLSIWRTAPGGKQPILIAHVPVGLGAAESPTPAGTTRIVKRVLDPEWTHPDTREVIPPRDPRNILGGYWIALDSEGIGKSGIGLHGFTGDVPANWIEQPASHGCVRLLQPDVDRVFHLALEGTPLRIVP